MLNPSPERPAGRNPGNLTPWQRGGWAYFEQDPSERRGKETTFEFEIEFVFKRFVEHGDHGYPG